MKHFSVGFRSRSRTLIYVLAWVCLGISAESAHAAVWYVDKDNASGVEDGRSWGTAYRTIQPAIDAAHAEGGGDVWVAEGVYDEARNSLIPVWDNINYRMGMANSGSVVMYPNILLYGGFSGIEDSLAQRDWVHNITSISGRSSRDGNIAYHVIVCADNTVIDGIKLESSKCNYYSDDIRWYEACLLTTHGCPSLRNCTFRNNIVITNFEGFSAFVIKNNSHNIRNCLFENNITSCGGVVGIGIGISAHIEKCVFINNDIIDGYGDTVFTGTNSNVSISNALLSNNDYSHERTTGRGISKYINTIFINNKYYNDDNDDGSSIAASNCVFWGNIAARYGGAVGLDGVIDCGIDDTPCDCVSLRTLSNCTFAKNRAGIAGGAVWANAANIWNCILWDDEPNEIAPWDEAQNYVNYSLIEGGMPSGMQTLNTCLGPFCNNTEYDSFPTELGILDQDPKFVTGPSGTCTGLAYDAEAVQSVLTDSGASLTPGAWKGAYLGVGTGANEYWYYIIDNDANTLRVWADVTEGGTVSAPIAYEVMTHRLAPDSPCIDAGANTTIACYGGVTTDIEGKQRGLDGDGVDNALAGDGSGYDIGAWEYPETGCGYGLMFEREFAALVKALPDLIGAEAAAQLDADPATLDFEHGAAWLAWFNGGSVGLEPALGDGVPDLWQLRLMAETFCAAPGKSGQDAWLDYAAAFRDIYLANRELWVTKIESLLRTSMPAANRSSLEYVRRETSRVYPALLSISGATRDAYLALLTGLGMTGNYTPVTWPGKTVLEPFSGPGDLDRDGRDNATEYDDVISAGGDVDDYIQQAGYNDPFWPGNPAIPIDPWTLTVLTLSLALCATRRLGQRR